MSHPKPEFMRALCRHTLLDFYDCPPARLKHAAKVKAALCAAVRRGGGRIVKALFHNFSPYGVSGVVVITESHVTIHTWPEHAYAAVDILSCSEKLDHAAIRSELERALAAQRAQRKTFRRGLAAPKRPARYHGTQSGIAPLTKPPSNS